MRISKARVCVFSAPILPHTKVTGSATPSQRGCSFPVPLLVASPHTNATKMFCITQSNGGTMVLAQCVVPSSYTKLLTGT